MKTATDFYTIILIFMGLTFYGCFTSKVNDIVEYQPKSEELVEIKSAYISDDNNLNIVYTGRYSGKRKEYQYQFDVNIDTVIAMNKIPNTSVNIPSEVAAETGILKIDYYKQNDTSFYLVNLDRKKLAEINITKGNIKSSGIISQLKTDVNFRYDGFNSENRIIITYFPENKDYHYIALGVGRKWTNNTWGYFLYPFAIAIDIITLPIQFIYLVVNYKHPFKN